MNRVIFHVDCDYFFAQIEELRNPSIKGKPVVVCVYSGRTADSGAVGTANYPARKLGIHSGMPIIFAKKKATLDTVFLPVDIAYYSTVSEKIVGVFHEFASIIEKTSIDEAFLDVSDETKGDFSKAKELAVKLKEEIRRKTGITVSIGIAPNKLVAKIASGHQKPDGLTIVEPLKVREFLSLLDVEKIPGIGGKTSARLYELNVKTVEELSKIPLARLVDDFGNARGVFMHNASLGIDESEVSQEREKKQLSVIRTLKQDAKSFQQMNDFLKELSEKLFERVKNEGIFFKTVSIIAIDSKLESFTRSKTLETPTASAEAIYLTAKSLFDVFFSEKKGVTLRRGGVSVTNFSDLQKQKNLSDFA